MNKSEDTYDSALMRVLVQPLLDEDLARFDAYNQNPHAYSERFCKKISKIFRKERILSYGKVSLVWMKRAAIYAMVAILILLASCVTIKPLREKIANAFVEWYSEYVAVSMESKSLHPTKQIPTYVPPNYHVVQDVNLNDYRVIRYSDDEGNLITFRRQLSGDTVLYDYEHHMIEVINVGGCKGLFFTGESEYNTMTWSENGYTYMLDGPFEKRELLEIAESLKAE